MGARLANEGDIEQVAFLKSFIKECLSWETHQDDKGNVGVTCHITHAQGHRESVSLKGPIDESGNKNRSATTEENALFRKDFLTAIKNLPADEHQAVVLRIMGYDEESEDPKKRTIATICGVTGRTIRNRLKRAAAKLSKYKRILQ